jgi:hypothetical protein
LELVHFWNQSIKLDKTDMKNTLIIQSVIIIGIGLLMAGSCTYDEVLPYEPDPTVDVLFSQDIIPIFENKCSTAGCHNGAIAPDLRSSVAYDVLWTGGYINTAVPDQSELYLWMIGARGAPMPPTGTNEVDNVTVLQWIEQGALNN